MIYIIFGKILLFFYFPSYFYRFYYTNCTHFGASVSSSTDTRQGYYVLHCEGPGLPLAGVHSVTTHKMVRVLYDTRIQRAERLAEWALPTRKSFEVKKNKFIILFTVYH